ncbi:hypothetical protein DL96DRAFT_239389 [Flagelloscypha sp. PMI_526]|nr:hypothetical protein DL96DRAFT_239389 [Flagelloscypha sp. PMI_526]
MVVFTSTLFLLANAIAICHALPTPYSARTIEARRPTVGQPLTLSLTKNNLDTGTFTTDGGPVTVIVGDKIADGSSGVVFRANCGADTACQALGPVVLKFYTSAITTIADDEQKHLAKIGELKAVSTGAGDKLSLMKGFTGKKFSETDAYLALTDKVTDKTKLDIPKITTLVKNAAALAERNGIEYLTKHQILHKDINDGNVLFTESGGEITAAQLIDWDDAVIVPAAQIAATQSQVTGQKRNFDRFFEDRAFEKSQADKKAAAPPKKPVSRPVAPAVAPGTAKPAPPKVGAAVPPPARPVAPRPATQPPAPPPSGVRPATPPANQKP